MSAASVREIVVEVIVEIARLKNPSLREVRDDQSLTNELGLESLDLAQLVAELELRLGVDPFATEAVGRVVTVGDVVAAYKRALPA